MKQKNLVGEQCERKKMLVVGGGGHARVVTDIILDNGLYDIVGFIDNDKTRIYRGISVIGTDDDLNRLYEEGIKKVFIALGNNLLRKKLQIKCQDIGYEIITVISRFAYISPTVAIGRGSVVMPGAILHANVTVGEGCIINTNSSVDHDSSVGGFSHIAPGSAVSGYTCIGEQCFLGTGSSVIDHIKIGSEVIIGAGGVVIKNVSDNVKIVGVPGKKLKCY